MKKLFTLLTGVFFTCVLFAQGSIDSIKYSPLSPFTSDSVTVYVYLRFNLSDCSSSQKTFSTVSDSTNASSLHCLQGTSDSCFAVDTFHLGKLQGGTHYFRYSLNSGTGGLPCTPGILPADEDSIEFDVAFPAGIRNSSMYGLSFFPNPFTTSALIRLDASQALRDAELRIVDLMGKTVKTIGSIQSNEITVPRDGLVSGVYFYQLSESSGVKATGRFMVE